jgi:lipoprotein-anchoring transpeptidase ErfK/SrfK
MRREETVDILRALCLATVAFIAVGSEAVAAEPASFHTAIAWQLALERSGFSPGIIDGQIGRKTELATREFQRARGLPVSGRLDARTAAALAVDPDRAVTVYTVQPADLAQVGPAPDNWLEKSKLARLGYESMAAALAEKFHCTRGLLARLNPGCDLGKLAAGDVIRVPAVTPGAAAPVGQRLVIDLAEKTVRVVGASGEVLAMFHCSIAKKRENLPTGEAAVTVMTREPTYTFDPKMWPEVKGVDRRLLIPPGPRNPVGLCWIGMNRPGYGIHGSPAPEMIGKTGSHGCFRLTNWDALRLSQMIRIGAPVRFVGGSETAEAGRDTRRVALAERR